MLVVCCVGCWRMAEAGERLIPGGHTHNSTTEVTPTTSTVNKNIQQQSTTIWAIFKFKIIQSVYYQHIPYTGIHDVLVRILIVMLKREKVAWRKGYQENPMMSVMVLDIDTKPLIIPNGIRDTFKENQNQQILFITVHYLNCPIFSP